MQIQAITEIAIKRAEKGVLTREQAACWVKGSGARLDALLKRAVASGEIWRVRRGLYCLSKPYLQRPIDALELAQRIHGPSYISLESALSYHGWIPEAVRAITSVSLERSREFDTPLGLFTFTRVPQQEFFGGVIRTSGEGGDSFFLATPLKALSDYVYVNRCNWTSMKPVLESLRVDEDELGRLTGELFDQLMPLYKADRVRRFLAGFRKDLRL